MTIEYFINNWKNIKEEDISFSKKKWKDISAYQYLSEEFIEKYKDKVNWRYVSIHQSLSEEFIEKHKDKVNWSYISIFQQLSEELIEKYKNEVDWFYISTSQILSKEFIYKHQDKISHSNCLNKYYRLRYEKYNSGSISFSIHTNNSYGIILQWKYPGFDIKNFPVNIIFCHTL